MHAGQNAAAKPAAVSATAGSAGPSQAGDAAAAAAAPGQVGPGRAPAAAQGARGGGDAGQAARPQGDAAGGIQGGANAEDGEGAGEGKKETTPEERLVRMHRANRRVARLLKSVSDPKHALRHTELAFPLRRAWTLSASG